MIEITLIQSIIIWIAIGSFSHALLVYLCYPDYKDDDIYIDAGHLDFVGLCLILTTSSICIMFWPVLCFFYLMQLIPCHPESHINCQYDPLDEYDYPTEMKK